MRLTFGVSTSFDDVATHFHADDAKPITDFGLNLKSLLALSSNVYVDLPPSASTSRRTARIGFANTTKSVLQYLSPDTLGRPKSDYDTIVEGLSSNKRRPLAPEVGRLRAVKSVHEQKVMRKASDISARAHTKVRFGLRIITHNVLIWVCRPCVSHGRDCPKALWQRILNIFALCRVLSDLLMCL